MPKIIEAIKYYSCGYCVNRLSRMFKQTQPSQLLFPAGVLLIKHQTAGYILYDTGYTTELYQKKWLYQIYNRVNPTYIKREEMIDQQLQQAGIAPETIQLVILSHLHPDHIGGVRYFPNAQFLLSEGAYQTYQHRKFKDLIFTDFLPADFEERLHIIRPDEQLSTFPFKPTYDLLKDGSLLLSSFDGHAKGQLCLYFPEYQLFVGADICWGVELLDLTPKLRRIPGLIQNNLTEYHKSVQVLRQIIAAGQKVVVSHDPESRVNEVLR